MMATKIEKKANRLTKALSKSRVAYSLSLSLGIMTGFGISKVFTGNFLEWLFYHAPIVFPVIFIITYGFIWPKFIKKTEAKLLEISPQSVVVPAAASKKEWIIAALIMLLVASPYLFRESLSKLGFKYLEDEITAITIPAVTKEGTQTILNVPALYLVSSPNLFKHTDKNQWSLTAKISDLEPIRYSSAQSNDPKDFLSIRAVHPNNRFFKENQHIYKELSIKASEPFDESAEYKLGLVYASLNTPFTGKHRSGLWVERMKVWRHFDKKHRNMLIMCSTEKCMIAAYIHPISLFNISFHPSNFDKWPLIYNKANKLLTRFQEPLS